MKDTLLLPPKSGQHCLATLSASLLFLLVYACTFPLQCHSATILPGKHGPAGKVAHARADQRYSVGKPESFVQINEIPPHSDLVIEENSTFLVASNGTVDFWNTTVMNRVMIPSVNDM